jgi:hypothetical protein
MPSFAVTVTTTLLPAVSVQLSGTVTYQQFRNSLGQYIYKVNKAYFYSLNQNQIQGVINYNIYDANGERKITNIVSAIDPYQTSPSIFLNLKDRGITLNGQDDVQLNLLPNTQLSVKLYVDRITNQDSLNETSLDNFESEQAGDGIDFFKEYNDFV